VTAHVWEGVGHRVENGYGEHRNFSHLSMVCGAVLVVGDGFEPGGAVAVSGAFEPWRGGTCESRRRAGYSTTMSLPDTDTVPRLRGQTFVSILNVVPSPGILAKICWGPRTICPFSTS
jgi:hypothetical protein